METLAQDVVMAYVAINVLSVPDGKGSLLEERFAGRAGSVERADGFRPVAGTDSYLVYTRWRDREAFESWTASRSFAAGHAEASGRPAGQPSVASGSTIWAFEVVQSATPVHETPA